MVTFLISARFNYTVDEEVLPHPSFHPTTPGRPSAASISLSTRFGLLSLLPLAKPISSRQVLNIANPQPGQSS